MHSFLLLMAHKWIQGTKQAVLFETQHKLSAGRSITLVIPSLVLAAEKKNYSATYISVRHFTHSKAFLRFKYKKSGSAPLRIFVVSIFDLLYQMIQSAHVYYVEVQ